MRYYIFGASGFIGTHLVEAINEQYPVSDIFNLDLVDNNHGGRSTYVECDVRREITLPEGVAAPCPDDVVVNLAAIHRTPGHPDYAYYETNILGAKNVSDFAAKYGVRRLVFTSSIAPYAASEDEKFEDTLPTPNTPYGISKLVAENEHRTWQAGSPDRELTILRPGVVFGKGENGNFTRLYWSIRGHKFAFPGRKDTVKACIYVKDLVGFILYNIHNRKPGSVELYNCTYEPAYTIGQIVDHMKSVTGLRSWTPLVPKWVIMPAAYLCLIIGSPMGICPARVRKLMVSTNICGKKMAATGYKIRYSIDEAIADWLRDSGGDGMK